MKNKNEIEALQRQLKEEIKARKMAEDSLKKREKEISILKIEQTLLLEKLENSDAEYINQTTILENIIQETPYPVIWISPGDLQIIFTNESGNEFLNQLKRIPTAKKKWEKFVLNPVKNNTHTTLDLHLKETIYQIHGIYIPELNQKVIYAFDISRLKATQEALLKSETRYKIMVESVTDIIYRVTHEGFFTYVNPIAEKILGYSIEEFKKMHFSDLIREDYREEIVTYYINQGINDIPNSYKEFPVITKSGKEIWIGQNVTLVFENGLVSEVYALARDITSIKKTEEEIESSANRMKSLVENLEAGILMEDENRKIIHVNETFCKLLRIPVSPKELIGQDCTNFANLSKHLFADPDLFVSEIDQLI
ncbi:MAG: PAS domain S-box protein, partial [Flavobacteriales bacterium]|nr:PAS domain S-box protein [Flavobacteriales bacterium]